MSVNLQKGQGVSLSKNQYDLSQVTVGLGWDIAEKKKSFFQSLFNNQETEYDLDVVAFLCNSNGKIANLGHSVSGKPSLTNSDIIFFNNLKHSSGHVWLTGDNRTGEGDGDDEQIILKLNDLSEQYQKIVFIVQIYDAHKRKQHFGEVENAFIRAVDAKGNEMVRFNLSSAPEFNHKCSMIFAELNRETDGWQFKAIGQAGESDSFVYYIQNYS